MTTMRAFLVAAVTFLFYICEGKCQPSTVCTTPNNETASCVSIFSCPVLAKSVGSSDPATIDFVKKSLCGGGSCNVDIKVCCGTSGSYSAPPTKTNVTRESHRDFVIRKLLPTRKYCGLQHTDDRFYNESETALDEFPWLVHVKWYDVGDEGDFDERCNGVLISNLYVLTDYDCGFHARTVKLGQHATSRNVSCIEDPFYTECTDATLEIAVVEKFWYAVPTVSGSYNFVLMRLARKVSYTDYIRPICLPVDESIRSIKHDSFTFSGWGASGPNEATKKRLIYNLTDVNACYNATLYLDGWIKRAKVDLVCLIAREDNKAIACNGDHGGPLMFSHTHQWFAHGILFSVLADARSHYCSNDPPAIGLAITSEIVEWILSKMHG